jgi:hypothetical protein
LWQSVFLMENTKASQICKLNLISSEFIWKSSFWKVQKRRYYSFSLSVTYDRSVVSPRRFGVLHQKNWLSQYQNIIFCFFYFIYWYLPIDLLMFNILYC